MCMLHDILVAHNDYYEATFNYNVNTSTSNDQHNDIQDDSHKTWNIVSTIILFHVTTRLFIFQLASGPIGDEHQPDIIHK
ncbi:hypothetical protein ANO11243_071440 [Dothideomycetidae sp. 11243]|nr:hypothetical protein ANO11243_071440 [fungal sp. No.11243]